MSESSESLEIFGSPLPRDRSQYFAYVDYKAASFQATKDEASFEFKARSVFDPKLRRYRCPPGTRHGGRITNRMGVGCGGNIVRRALGAARRIGRAVDTPSAPGLRQATEASRTARRARRQGRRGRAVAANVGRAREAFQASGRAQVAANLVNPYTSNPARIERLNKLNAFGRALARFAERVDIDDEELTEIARRTGIPEEDLTPERRERLGKLGEQMNGLLNRWADRVDVDLEDVDDLPERTDGAPDEGIRQRRNRRERRGIAQRERQIQRRRRLDEVARRVDIDDDVSEINERAYNDYLTTGGRMRNPDRRRINSAFVRAVRPADLNDDKRDRLYQAAETEYHNLHGFWERRLGRRDFTFNDINRHIKNHEKNPEDEAAPEGLRALRDDWAELRPFFDPVDNEFQGNLRGQADAEEVVAALARLDPDRKRRILENAQLDRTEAIADIQDAQNEAEKFAIEKIRLQKVLIDKWERDLRAGNMDEASRQALLKMHGDLAGQEERLKKVREQAEKALRDFDNAGEGNPAERARLVAAQRLAAIHAAGVQGNRLNLTDLRRKYPQLDNIIRGKSNNFIPARFQDIGPEGEFVLGTPSPLPKGAGSLGRIDEQGLPELKLIENPDIPNEEAAIDFVRGGGDLNEVPNQFWFAAIDKNATSNPDDPDARFFAVRPHQGFMGDTSLYFVKDENGKVTEKGWVFKSQYDEANVHELMGWVVAEMAGVGAGMPGWDGRQNPNAAQNVILPIGNNMAPDGPVIKREGADPFDIVQLRELPDAGAPARVVNAAVAYLAAAHDRKSLNAYSFVVGDKGYALPLDMGLAFNRAIAGRDFSEYVARNLGEDNSLPTEINAHLLKVALNDRAEAVKQAEAVVDAFDKVIANARRLRNMEPSEWRDRIKKGVDFEPSNRFDPDMEEGFQIALSQLEQLERDREQFLSAIIPHELAREIRDNRLDELNRVTNEASRQNKWADSPFVPDAEAAIDFSIDTPRKAAQHLLEGGNLAALPDQVYIPGVLGAGTLRDERGNVVDIDRFLGAEHLPGEMSNDRFSFRLIKSSLAATPWHVYKMEDKHTNTLYYLKAGTYGHTEALNEVVGAELQQLFGFDIDEVAGNVRVSPNQTRRSVNYRWIITPHLANYNNVSKSKRDWKDIHKFDLRELSGNVNEEDIARFAIFDYLINNQDRHQGNVKAIKRGGQFRLAPFDHGLIGFARRDGIMAAYDEDEISRRADEWADITPLKYRDNATNNPFKRWITTKAILKENQKAQVQQHIERLIREMQAIDLENLFNADRMGRRGIDWTPTELAHIEAMKRIFEARLNRLKQNPGIMEVALK